MDDVDLVVPSGVVVGLVGGKPMPRHGRRPVQMVFQDPFASLDPRMTVGESIAEAIPRRRLLAGTSHYVGGSGGLVLSPREEAKRLAELVGLPGGAVDAYPARLSGGQRRRVALARPGRAAGGDHRR